jgi:hypothetical protein
MEDADFFGDGDHDRNIDARDAAREAEILAKVSVGHGAQESEGAWARVADFQGGRRQSNFFPLF